MWQIFKFLIFLSVLRVVFLSEENCVKRYMKYAGSKLHSVQENFREVQWTYFTNTTDENKCNFLNAAVQFGEEAKKIRGTLLKFNTSKFKDDSTKRQISILTKIRENALSAPKIQELYEACLQDVILYEKIKIPDFHEPTKLLSIEEIQHILSLIRNPAELIYLWEQWRSILGPKIRPLFLTTLKLKMEAAKYQGLERGSQLWVYNLELSDVKNLTLQMFEQLKPFYVQMHAFVRFKLREIYELLITEKGALPMHLIGELNAESFQWLSGSTLPFNDTNALELLSLTKQKCKRCQLYQLAEEVFVSMGFPKLPAYFWHNSIFEASKSVEQVCHPIRFHFSKGSKLIDCFSAEDFSSLPIALAAIGDVEKNMLCKSGHVFCGHVVKAVSYVLGGLMEISTQTLNFRVKGSQFVGKYTGHHVFNNLYHNALNFFPKFLSFYMLFLWRTRVYGGVLKENDFNCDWWHLAYDLLGIEPAVNRTHENFDPGCSYPIAMDKSVVQPFLGYAVAYELHKHFCLKTGLYNPGDPEKPLHECNLFGQKSVADFFKEVLQYGMAKPWYYIWEMATGDVKLNVDAIKEYYKPLFDWLVEENRRNKEFIGWMEKRTVCKTTP